MTEKPPCICGGTICGIDRRFTVRHPPVRKRTYVCKGCKRRVPWCFGAADHLPYHCDDCWTPEALPAEAA
jgi:hypothetical protein